MLIIATEPKVLEHSPAAVMVIPSDKTAVYSDKSRKQRNRNILAIALLGRMTWQELRKYDKHN